MGATSVVAHQMDAHITKLSLELYRGCRNDATICNDPQGLCTATPLSKNEPLSRAIEMYHFYI